ncbi:MAG TPA: DUF1761 domain-containing protein [Microvirga sp.]|nr:DUF1761 domain-containing protein [Microvirga sp.]
MDYLAVAVAAAASWLAGAVWYTALARPWMSAIGKTREELMGPGGKPSALPFVVSFLAELVMAWALAGVIGHLGGGQVTLANGLISGFFIWLGFVATTLAVNHRFGGARPMLTVIDGGHWLAVLLVQGAVIGLMGT